jgi:hypothetical protein
MIVKVVAALTGPQGPSGSFDVYVNVTEPATASDTLGVYTALGALLLNVPDPLVLHVPLVALPPKVADIVADPLEQMV